MWWLRWKLRDWREKAEVGIANALPRWLCYRACIRVGAEVTVRDPVLSKVEVPEVKMMDALESFSKKGPRYAHAS